MKSPDWNAVLSKLDEDLLQEAIATYGQRETSLRSARKDECMNKRTIRRINRTGLMAAVLALALAVGALAAGLSIHRQRQEELRQDLNIDGASVSTYVEFDAPETDDSGVTLLSAVYNNEWQHVYVNVSPVEWEEIASWPEEETFAWTISGGEEWGMASPWLEPGTSVSGDDITSAVLEHTYDEATKTLTLECIIWVEKLSGGQEELQLARVDLDSGSIDPIGTVYFTPTELELRHIDLGDTVITDAQTGREIHILGVDMTATGLHWHLRYNDADKLYTGIAAPELSTELLQMEDRLLSSALLHFADGSTFAPGVALSADYEKDTAMPFVSWKTAIDIHAVTAISFGDVTVNW